MKRLLGLGVALSGAALGHPVHAQDLPVEAEAEVEVRGQSGPGASRDRTGATTVIAGKSLARAGASSADVLATVPGVQVARTGSASDLATAGIRGATSSETPVYLAGVRLNDDVTGIADLSTIPLWMLDRVEVYRGGAPFDVDRLGLGGAVLFEPRFPRVTEARAGAGVGSFGERAGWLAAGVRGDRAAALFAVRAEGADNDYSFRDATGTHERANADFTSENAWAVSRYELGPGARITALVHAFHREQGSPGFAVLPEDSARTEARRELGAVSTRVPCGRDAAGAESCSVELTASALAADSILRDPRRAFGSTAFVDTRGRRFEGRARVLAEASSRFSLGASFGASAEKASVIRPGAELSAHRSSVRPAATATLHATSETDVVAMAALECHTTDGAGQPSGTCATLEPGGRLGARHGLSEGLEFRGNAGHAARVPTLGELYGVSSVVRGNPTLRPESGESADAGFRASGKAGRLRGWMDVFGFARTSRDLIAYRRNTLGVVVPYNVGRARILGAEVEGAADLLNLVRDELTLTFLDARDATPERGLTNDYLPFRSRLVLTDYAELYTDTGFRALALDGAALGLRVTYRGSRYADEAGLLVLPGSTAFDAEARLSFLGFASARFALRNLAGAREIDAVGLPVPGRSAHLEVEVAAR